MAATSVSASINVPITIAEVMNDLAASGTNAQLTHTLATLLNTYVGITSLPLVLNNTSNPRVQQVAIFSQPLTAGSATIDMTNMTMTDGRIINANGQTLQLAIFINPSANGNVIKVVPGAANGYNIGGVSTDAHNIQPGAFAIEYGAGKWAVIGSTNKTLDLSGTGTQNLICVLLFG